MNNQNTAFNLFKTYAYLAEASARLVPVNNEFWRNMMSGDCHDFDHGWLVSAYELTGKSAAWEMHPAGDELLYLISGSIIIFFE